MTRRAIINIFSSYNNILMTATDLTGAETITTCSGGQVVKSSKDSGGQFAATRAAEKMADTLKEKEFTQLIIKYRAPGGNLSNNTGPGAQAAIRALTRAGMTITRIEDVTPIDHDGAPVRFTTSSLSSRWRRLRPQSRLGYSRPERLQRENRVASISKPSCALPASRRA